MKLILGLLACSVALAQSGAHGVGYKLPGGATGTKPTNVEAELSTRIDAVHDFGLTAGAVGSTLCAANATALHNALLAAIAGGKDVAIPAGTYPTNPVLSGTGSTFYSASLRGPGTLQSCTSGAILTIQGGWKWKLNDLYFDCNNVSGSSGLLITVDASNNPPIDMDAQDIQVRNCPVRGIIADWLVNSHMAGLKIYNTGQPLAITNHTNSVTFRDVEAQGGALSTTSLVYMGADSTLPGALGGAGAGVSVLAIHDSIVECNGTPCPVGGTISVDFNNANSVSIYNTAINANMTALATNPAIVKFGANSYGNGIYASSLNGFPIDTKFVVNANTNTGGPNVIRDTNFLFTSGGSFPTCTQTAVTSQSLLILDNVTTNLPACLTLADTSGGGVGTTIRWNPSASFGTSYFGNPPTGTVGSFYYGANGPQWWNNNAFKDVNGNTPGTARTLSGSGTPNGAVVGSPGDTYRNLTGGPGTTIYVKETGTATNTGWIGK